MFVGRPLKYLKDSSPEDLAGRLDWVFGQMHGAKCSKSPGKIMFLNARQVVGHGPDGTRKN